MQKIALFFVAAAAFLASASALECYSCDSQSCLEASSKWSVVPCGKNADSNHIGACLKQVYTDKNTNKDVTTRRCVLADKPKNGEIKFNCNPNNNEPKIVTCEVCTTDLCNSAPTINLSAVTFLGVIVTILFSRIL